MPLLVGCLLLTPTVRAGDKATQQTIAYLRSLQTESGGFRSHDPGKGDTKVLPTLRATSSAVRALGYFGGDVPDKAAVIKFVESCWDDGFGAFTDMPKGKPDVFTNAVALMAVTALKIPDGKYIDCPSKYLNGHAKSFEEIRIAAAGFETIKTKPAHLDKWVTDVLKLQNKESAFGKGLGMARDTASCEVTLMRLTGKPAAADVCLKTIKAGQRQNGGWGKDDSETASDMETTYRVMRCFMMLKARPDNVEGVRSFVAKCRNPDGGYAAAPGQPSNVSGTYFAGIILHWLKD
jgi:prenyltransferase beta subunit